MIMIVQYRTFATLLIRLTYYSSDVSQRYACLVRVDIGSTCAYLAVVDERKIADNRQGKKGGKNAISAFVR